MELMPASGVGDKTCLVKRVPSNVPFSCIFVVVFVVVVVIVVDVFVVFFVVVVVVIVVSPTCLKKEKVVMISEGGSTNGFIKLHQWEDGTSKTSTSRVFGAQSRT